MSVLRGGKVSAQPGTIPNWVGHQHETWTPVNPRALRIRHAHHLLIELRNNVLT
ncbi:hypothetical protein CC2G_003541, partial [Coprinopsis cinerea AmutBmut pab1-1]